jgi:hypothetical protein
MLLRKLSFFCIVIFSFVVKTNAQNIDKIINAKEVERIEATLSSDAMEGRKPNTPGIEKAANYIASEFAKSKLGYFGNATNYMQEFRMVKAVLETVKGTMDEEEINETNYFANTTQALISLKNTNWYETVHIKKEDDFFKQMAVLRNESKNLIVLVDKIHVDKFKRLSGNNRAKFSTPMNQIFLLTNKTEIKNISLEAKYNTTEQKLKNVVAVIPGKSKKEEFVVFSGHYDHLGIGKPNKDGDSIYNGANDDAAGTTAVMLLAKYFAALKQNERTLIFVAFTAEEIGGFGSQYFSKQLNADKVVAMFNIEMIGTESKWGANSAYITGYDKSNMGTILQSNLVGSKFKFEPDPYPKQNLFYRSDNATLAALGVPAHTISTAKMEEVPNNEPNYHKLSDEIGTLNMANMTEIIKAIAISSKSIVDGSVAPSRVKKVGE